MTICVFIYLFRGCVHHGSILQLEDLHCSVDAGALVQQEPCDLDMAEKRRAEEACTTILRTTGTYNTGRSMGYRQMASCGTLCQRKGGFKRACLDEENGYLHSYSKP